MKTKKVKVSGKPFSSRTVIGIVCIVLAFAITFGVAPLVNRFTDRKVDIVRLKSDVGRGQIITANDIEIVNVGAHNLPSSVIKDSKTVVGKYAATDLYAEDYLLPTKLSENNKSADDVLLSLNGEKMAISVNIEDFATGLSDKLENGDIVSLIVYDDEEEKSFIPEKLKYVRVITTTTSDGIDKDENTEGENAATVTLLVRPEQAELLAQYNNDTTIHFALVYRGDDEKADEYIRMQDEYLAAHPNDTEESEDENG